MEQNREPRNRPTQITLTNEERQYKGAKIIFSMNNARITGHLQTKN